MSLLKTVLFLCLTNQLIKPQDVLFDLPMFLVSKQCIPEIHHVMSSWISWIVFTSSKSTFDISFWSTKLILIEVVFCFLLSSGTHDFLFLSPVSKHRLRRLKETATSVSLPLSLPASYSSLNCFHTGTLIEKREFLFFWNKTLLKNNKFLNRHI